LRYDDSQNRERRGLSNPKFAHALAVVMNCGRRARGMYQVCARILFRPESDLTGCLTTLITVHRECPMI
jgi:hypothetical protein